MITYTAQEKEQAKLARKSFKQKESVREKERRIENELYAKRKAEYEKRKDLIIRTGILESERLMNDDDPVYGDYLYVIDHEGGKVIRSNIYRGNVRDLKRSLYADGYKFQNVYTCDMNKRNFFAKI